MKFYLNITLILVLGMIVAIIFILRSNLKNRKTNKKLAVALINIKTLKGLLPICSHCKNIRDDKGYWHKVEEYLHQHSDIEFSHSLCPDCLKKYYPKHKNRG